MPPLRFWLLGSFQIWRENVQLDPAIPGPRALSLLALLLTQRDQYVASDYIVDQLWPHLQPDAAVTNLQVAIGKLRRWLEPQIKRGRDSRYLQTESGGYRFRGDDCYVDVDDFTHAYHRGRAALHAGNGEAALRAFDHARSLYRGGYLEEWPYDEWALSTRTWLQDTCSQLLEALAELHFRAGQYEPAIDVCRRALQVDALHEACVRTLMHCHAARGETAEALAVYAQYAELLQQELAAEPASATQGLRDAIDRGAVPYAGPELPQVTQTAPAMPLVGRTDALTTLIRARREHVPLLLIAGETGVGKTRLLTEWAAAQQATVLWSQIGEHAAPFAAALDLFSAFLRTAPPAAALESLGPLGAVLAERLPALRRLWPGCPPFTPLTAEAEQQRLKLALVDGLRLAAAGPLILILDDLQWIDADSLAVMSELLAGPPANTLMVCAYRSDDIPSHAGVQQWLAEQRRQESAVHLDLGRLTAGDVLEGVRALTNLPDPDRFSRRLHAVSGGHPLFLVEILYGLIEEGRLYRGRDGVWRTEGASLADPDDLPLSATLRETVLARTRRLDPFVIAVLEAVSVLHTPSMAAEIASVLHARTGKVSEALDSLADRHLLAELDGGTWTFSHQLIGEIFYTNLRDTQRQLLHRLAAQALAAQGEGPGERAVAIVDHLQRGDGDAAMLARWSVWAGEWSFAQFAPAQSYFELALAQHETLHPDRRDPAVEMAALEGLGKALQQSGRPKEALAALERGIALCMTSGDRARLLLLAARVCERDLGEYDRALALIEQAEEALTTTAGYDHRAVYGEIHLIRASIHHWRGNYSAGEESARLALVDAVQVSARTRALQILALNVHKLGKGEEAVTLYRQVLGETEAAGDLRGLAIAHMNLANGLQMLGRLAEALDAHDAAGQLMERLGDQRAISVNEVNVGILAQRAGDLERAERTLRRAAELAESVGAPYTVAVAGHSLGKALAMRGRRQEAERAFGAAIDLADARGAAVIAAQARVHYAEALMAWGEATEAETQAHEAYKIGESSGDNFCRRESRLILALCALQRGDSEAALIYARDAYRISVEASQAMTEASAARALGQIMVALGEVDESRRYFAHSQRLFRECGAQVELGVTLLAQARHDVAASADTRRQWLVEARRHFRRARALPLLKQTEEALASLGSVGIDRMR